MNIKKGLAVAVAVGIICSAMAGCTQKKPVVETTEPVTTTVKSQETTTAPAENTSVQQLTSETTAATTVTTTNNKGTSSVSSAASNSKTTTAKTANTNKSTTKKSVANNTATKKATTKKSTTDKATTKSTTTTSPTTTEAKEITIKLLKNGKAECKSSNVSIEAPKGLETDGIVYVEKGGDYIITSDTDSWHGQIVIRLANTESANIRFENVNISTMKPNAIKILDTNISAERSFIEADVSSGSAGDTDNALQDQMKEVSKIDKAPNVDLSFPTGTKSSLSSSANAMSGVIYNESKLTIKGNGAVDITSSKNRNNAICSTKSITFKNVSATLTTPGYGSTSSLGSARGIFSFSKVNIESGKLTIRSNGDCIRCEQFNSTGGTTDIVSSASDGIDADDAIVVTAGNVTSIALDKSAFKVRRVNNQENLNGGSTKVKADDGITKPTHTFRIDGGTVIGEGKNMTTPKKRSSVQQLSKQAFIYCRSTKAPGSEEAKLPLLYKITTGTNTVISSSNSCIKFLYSSSDIDTSKEYSVKGHNKNDFTSTVSFTDFAGDCKIVAS